MAVFNRLAWGVLYVVFLMPALASAFQYSYSGPYTTTNNGWDDDCYVAESGSTDCPVNPPAHSVEISHWTTTSTINNQQVVRNYYEHCSLKANPNGTVNSDGSGSQYLVGVNASSPSSNNTVCYYDSTPPPEPECDIPAGTEMGLSVDYMMGSTCYSNCIFNRSGRGACTYLNNGDTSCWSKYTSTGNYCDDDDGTSSRPFSDHTDENGCYRSTADGKAYCEKPNDYQCPNYVMVDGKKYCRETNEDDWDSDGDGNPDSSDPAPGDPNVGGDDGNGGDPGGDTGGDDGSGDPTTPGGDGESSGGEYGQGVCEPGQEITEPKCEPHLDAIQCGIFLNSWNLRCEEKQRHEDFVGTDEYRDGDSLTDSDNPANTVTTKEVSFSGFLDGLDDSGSGYGGAMACPPDKQINLGFGSITLPFTYICQWAEKIRPLIIALGWLAAGLIALKAMSEKE